MRPNGLFNFADCRWSSIAKNKICFLSLCFLAAFTGVSCSPAPERAASGDCSGASSFKVGWAEVCITPDEPVYLWGGRISEGVRDPITATALALESPNGRVVMVSCDLISVSDCIMDSVRAYLSEELPGLDPMSVFFGATHSHTAPRIHVRPRYVDDGEIIEHPYGIELTAMAVVDYVPFASRRIAEAVIDAWNSREPSGVAFGLGHAVVARNRIMAYKDGTSRMYGRTDVPEFSHVEGYEDHSVHVLGTYLPGGKLTGLIVNIQTPSQLSENERVVSADFWHETRAELRRRFGEDIFILPQHGPAGDQHARPPVERRAEQRMWRLAGRTQREEVGVRIADAVSKVLPLIEDEIDWRPELRHHVESVELTRRKVTEEDVKLAEASSARARERYERLVEDVKANPEIRERPRWWEDIAGAYSAMRRADTIKRRHEAWKAGDKFSAEMHVVRLGDAAFATNPFELYLDFGMRIRGRSPAVQNFLVQLAGPGSYVPTERSVAGGGYGAAVRSNEVGPEGGRELVEWTVDTLNRMWIPADVTVPRVDFPRGADGDFSKWEGMDYLEIGLDFPGAFGGKVYMGRDDDNLYLAAMVRDEKHFNTNEGRHIWDGDALQFAFAPREGVEAFNLGLALASGRVRSHKWRGPDTGLIENSRYAVLRHEDEGITFYEIKMPFESLLLEGREGEEFGLSVVVFNDDDGQGYDYWIELSRGLAGGWNPDLFGKFILGE